MPPPAGVYPKSVPEPLVAKHWLAEPSPPGMVQVKLEGTEAGACKEIYFVFGAPVSFMRRSAKAEVPKVAIKNKVRFFLNAAMPSILCRRTQIESSTN